MSAPLGDLRTVFVANRGEIALRVVRACRDLGLRSVVGYSSADAGSAAVRLADASVRIGPAPSRFSYSYAPAIVEAALGSGAQAVHPGYGFLSEDPDFAEICVKNGLVFVGPDPRVMARLGDKALARQVMAEAGVPVLPGSSGPVADERQALAEARRIGFPLIIKAAAGGGGRGMTVVRDMDELLQGFRGARAAAREFFGDERVYMERFLDRPRHIEVQVVADEHGSAVALGERDCSVQRRHQKLVEESPGPNLPRETACRLEDYALRGVRTAGYTGAGTFEFLVQGDEVAFIEVNCRIQVEHPVTEMVTGTDLVAEQLRVASGARLSVAGPDSRPRGVALECRVNAEDPDRGFVPCPGRITGLTLPGGPFVRVDSHAGVGDTLPPDYDSLLAKVIVWAPDREQAVRRMERALMEFSVEGPGIRTTVPLLRKVVADPLFRKGEFSTSFLTDRGWGA